MSAEEVEKTRVLQRLPDPAAAASLEGKIVFQCPNGHRLVVAAGLAGKRGKCGKCGIDVTIPPANDDSPLEIPDSGPPATASPAAAPESPLQPPVGAEPESAEAAPPAPGEVWDFMGSQPQPPAAADLEPAGWASYDAPGGLGSGETNPTALLVGRLWAERQHGGVIELHLSGGGVILPEWYDANWSRGTHGLFASQAADGSVTLTAVAWETVLKIVVRQLAEVPHDMFTSPAA
jgi:hypothetical protein